jgi:transcriptional regulator with XRE-family HTH domain
MNEISPELGQPVPTDVDKAIGARLRTRRVLLQMTQEKLGERLGLSPQQIHKYEKGCRIGAGRLAEIAYILDVPIMYFYDTQNLREDLPPGFIELLSEPYVAELLNHYATLSREAQGNLVSLLGSVQSVPAVDGSTKRRDSRGRKVAIVGI